MIRRPRLEDLLCSARLTAVVAPAGYGKTTLLTQTPTERPVVWHTCQESDRLLGPMADALASTWTRVPAISGDVDADQTARAQAIAGMLCDALPSDVVIVLDDVHVIESGDPAAKLLEALCLQLPPTARLVLSGRCQPPFSLRRLRFDDELVEITAAQLAFTEDEAAALLDEPGEVHRITGGWPIAVRLMAEAGAVDHPRPEPLFDYLADEVVGREPFSTRELLRTATAFDRFTAELLEELGHPSARTVLVDLVRRGLFVEQVRSAPGWFTLVPLAREFTADRLPMDEWERGEVHAVAARWFVERGEVARAVDSLAVLRNWPAITDLLADLLRTKGADALLAATAKVPHDARTPRVWQWEGVAHQVRGDWRLAANRFERAAAVDGLTAELAWRMAWIQHLRGGPEDALRICDSCPLTGADPVAESLLLSTAAGAHWALGDLKAAESTASEALERASGDDTALGMAHTVLAMIAAAHGRRDELTEHNDLALDHAQRAGDVLGLIRIRSNQASHLVEAGEHESALAEIEAMLPLADVTGFATYRAIGLHNRGEALLGLGRLDEAAADFHAAQKAFEKAGSWLAAAPLVYLGEVHRLRGDRALAGFALLEALRLASAKNTVPHLVLAHVRLANLYRHDDPERAREHAAKAVELGEGVGRVSALLAAARVGDAKDLCHEAYAVATRRGDRAGLAESLELLGQLENDRILLDQALTLWREVGDPLGEVRVRTAQAVLVGGAAGERLAVEAQHKAAGLGARLLAEAAAGAAETCRRASRPAVFIQTLGGFRVLRDGEPVPPTAWQSRKARDLVKILIARCGRPITREALGGLLWPDEEPERVANRLAVALSTARSVLRAGAGVVAEGDAVRLDPSLLPVDVVLFLADARAGLAAAHRKSSEALSLLTAAESAYHGDFLEEDPYEDWAVRLREEARLIYLQVVAVLAEHAERAGEFPLASRYCLRVLERDPYDENAHLTLVRVLAAAGSHGEARRCYQTYVTRMREIEVDPRPFTANRPRTA
ncbi:transcriptional regulator [Lentzea tibetensis]|uniref:Transcriptional regulator n=1 Tax=Lentzea tibetensis TaxID=2591470 RepID=A0A563EZU0_9PSEU|nr:BTAD domain-containing putative transcriptional regulator [Lentzea tibetensis]TWP53236.1 transcriptional regulator [Lentzea tibetensis]